MAKEAVTKALEDAGVPYDAIEAAVCSVVLKGRHLNLPPTHNSINTLICDPPGDKKFDHA